MRRPRSTKIVALSIVALGLVAGWWWARDTTRGTSSDQTPSLKVSSSQPRPAPGVPSAPSLPSKPRAPSAPSLPSKPSEPSEPPSDQRLTRIVPKLPAPRTLEPNDEETTAWIRKAQHDLWNELRKFATDAKLTDEQWRRFERDLLELGAMEAQVWFAPHDVSRDGVLELSDDLEAELAQRAAKYMTKQQLRTFEWRAGGWVTQVRRLYYLPRTVEEVYP